MLTAEGLLDSVVGAESFAEIDALTLLNVPSASLDIQTVLDLRQELESACVAGSAGVVVSLGTDTLEECAYLLDLTWRRSEPLVLTGAMRPSDAPGADGPANLLAAIATAASTDARNRGCLVVINDEVHNARSVRKTHTTKPNAFASPQYGPAGHVHEGAIHFHVPAGTRRWLEIEPQTGVPQVRLIKLTLGESPSLLEAVAETSDGVVVEAFGAGHVPADWAAPLAELARRKPVVLASRTGSGDILRNTYAFVGSEMLLKSGLTPAGRLDGLKARLLLTLVLMSGCASGEVDSIFCSYADMAQNQRSHADRTVDGRPSSS